MGDHTSKKEKKDKKEKKEKRSEADGVKKSKKEKKEKKRASLGEALDEVLQRSASPEPPSVKVDAQGDVDMEGAVVEAKTVVDDEMLNAALVPFCFPLAEQEKEVKKILKAVKKSAKNKTLRRGVKECVKALRKSESSGPPSSDISSPAAIAIIAADISPMDVISHLPVLCEDHNIPYIYVRSRAQLGEASATKRPTSVVLVCKSAKKKGEEVDQEWADAYAELVKIVVKASKSVKK